MSGKLLSAILRFPELQDMPKLLRYQNNGHNLKACKTTESWIHVTGVLLALNRALRNAHSAHPSITTYSFKDTNTLSALSEPRWYSLTFLLPLAYELCDWNNYFVTYLTNEKDIGKSSKTRLHTTSRKHCHSLGKLHYTRNEKNNQYLVNHSFNNTILKVSSTYPAFVRLFFPHPISHWLHHMPSPKEQKLQKAVSSSTCIEHQAVISRLQCALDQMNAESYATQVTLALLFFKHRHRMQKLIQQYHSN